MTSEEIRQKILLIATAEIGVKEKKGPDDEDRILEYKKATPAVSDTHDEVAWCASFVNWVLGEAGIEGTGSPVARSFLKWGKPCDQPRAGCLVVLRRGAAWQAHVGFFVRQLDSNYIKVLGGNQSDCVKVSTYRVSDVLGYRWVA